MSSLPFCLGLPVVDDIPPKEGAYVLRSKDEQDLTQKIRALQHALFKKDLIKIYHIGYRPDYPAPVSRYFAEVHVRLGQAEEYHYVLGLWGYSFYHSITTGMRGEQDETD